MAETDPILRARDAYLRARQRERNYYWMVISTATACKASYLVLPTPAMLVYGEDIANEYLIARFHRNRHRLAQHVEMYYRVINYYRLVDMLAEPTKQTIRFLLK